MDQLAIPQPGIVFMASGQGSQKPGMGLDLLVVDEVATAFAEASDVLGKNLIAIIGEKDPSTLNQTEIAQFAIAALSIGIGRGLIHRGLNPQALLGFSLGQISALALGSMISDRETFELIKVRAEAMAYAASLEPGAMSALAKGNPSAAEELVSRYDGAGILVAANYNSPDQTVVSGSLSAIEWAEVTWADQGGRARRLATAGAFHSPLMASAQSPLAKHLAQLDFQDPMVPILANHNVKPLTKDNVALALVDHLVSPVFFERSVRALKQAGATTFIEVGYGGVLSKLVHKIDPTLTTLAVTDKASFDQALLLVTPN